MNKDRFDLYLYSEPKKLQELHQELFDYLFNHPTQTFNQKYFEEYICDVKDKKTNIRHSEYSRINDEELKTIQHIFNYSTYISRNTNFSYYLAKLLDVTTCPYCNRQYIFTIKNTVADVDIIEFNDVKKATKLKRKKIYLLFLLKKATHYM